LEPWTANLLKEFLKNRGQVISWAGGRFYIGGQPSNLTEELAEFSGFKSMAGQPLTVEIFSPVMKKEIEFKALSGQDRLFHQRRQFVDGQLLFLANISPESQASGQVTLKGRSAEKWDCFNGELTAFPACIKKGRASIEFSLRPGESLLLAVYKAKKSGQKSKIEKTAKGPVEVEVQKIAPSAVKRLEPNVFTLDYCDLMVGGRFEKNLYFYQAQKKTYNRHGFQKNPWDSTVQYQDNIISRNKFSRGTGYRADFHFRVAQGVDLKSMKLAVERPEIFKVAVNGKLLEPLPDSFWLDRNFGLFPLEKAVRTGPNTVSLIVSPFDLMAELEPVYVLGNFSVEASPRGFLITPAKALKTGSWKDQGLTFYGNRVSYLAPLKVTEEDLKQKDFIFRTGNWQGALGELEVNGQPVGYLLSPFDSLQISSWLKPGANELNLIIYGTLKNTLGPHHLNPMLGRAWPGSFQSAPEGGQPAGEEYNVLNYGLFDFIIVEKHDRIVR
jgi:hypothetical protein